MPHDPPHHRWPGHWAGPWPGARPLYGPVQRNVYVTAAEEPWWKWLVLGGGSIALLLVILNLVRVLAGPGRW